VERVMGSLDKPPALQALHNYEAIASHTAKHIFMGFGNGQSARSIINMAAACSGGMAQFQRRPTVTAFVCPTSPLELLVACTDVIIECAQLGVPVAPISMVLAGATAPATLAGALVVHNAEVLSAIALAQLTRRGTPCIYASCSTVMDMRFAGPALGAPEYGMISAALTRMAQHYEIPCWVGGGHSDSKLPDAQAAYEFGLSATLAALSGANIVYGAGSLESGLTFDFAKLIMDAEQIRQIFKMLRGIEINDDTLAIDVIDEVGPGGEFLTHRHTFDTMRSISRTDLFDRRNRETWLENTHGLDLTERAYQRALELMARHQPLPLPAGAAEEMGAIIDEHEKRLNKDSALAA
jgi:trimethylamine--corrinoid protein Co-methyltransferase